MTRPNYFLMLEELSKSACEAVSIACAHPLSGEKSGASASHGTGKTKSKEKDKERLCEIRQRGDKMICGLEDSLFSDFIPPLQRDNIAALAHGFWRIISRASDHFNTSPCRQNGGVQNDEERLCVVLCEKLMQNTAMLREIRNPEKTPSLTEFRATLRRAGEAHSAYLSQISAGVVPRSCALRAFSTARLRVEISRCFDGLIEVMLGNI